MSRYPYRKSESTFLRCKPYTSDKDSDKVKMFRKIILYASYRATLDLSNALSIISITPFVAKLLTFEVVVILAKFNKIREI